MDTSTSVIIFPLFDYIKNFFHILYIPAQNTASRHIYIYCYRELILFFFICLYTLSSRSLQISDFNITTASNAEFEYSNSVFIYDTILTGR